MPASPGPTPDALVTVVSAVTDVLESHGIPHAVVGGIAAAIWGDARTTFDVDVLVCIPASDQDRLLAAFGADARFPIEPTVLRMSSDLTIVRAHFPDSSESNRRLILVDCLIPTAKFADSVLARRSRAEFWGVPIWVISPEDLIVMKLLAARPKDQEDIRAILRNVGERLDRTYVQSWVEQHAVQDLWNRLQADADAGLTM